MASPRRLGRYQLLFTLGRGGMGEVWLALQPGPFGFRKLVVVKELRSDLVSSSQSREMFLDEARLAARLNHPNVVQVLEVGEDAGTYFMAMEYLEGRSLEEILSESNPTLPLLLGALVDVLAGLEHAHELADFDGSPLGIVHRDISPDNLFVSVSGATKILDFGVAKASISSSRTGLNQVKGKLSYMAPEQVKGESLDARTDLFAVGVVLWEILTGRRMWADESDVGIIYRLTQDRLPPVEEFAPDLPAPLLQIASRALALDPRQRFEDARSFRVALEDYLRETGGPLDGRELGRYVAATFTEALTERRHRIEGALEGRPGQGPVSKPAAPTTQRYKLESQLGGGTSYRTWDQRLEREVALARYPVDLSEASLSERLQGPAALGCQHTAPIIDGGRLGRPPVAFVVRSWIEGSPWPTPGQAPESVMQVVRQVARSLAEAHQAGIAHGRLRPGRVILSDVDGRPFATVIGYEEAALGAPPSEAMAAWRRPPEAPTPRTDVVDLARLACLALQPEADAEPDLRALPGPEAEALEAALDGRFETATAFLEALERAAQDTPRLRTGTLRRFTIGNYEPLAQQTRVAWLFDDGPGISSAGLAPAWAMLEGSYELVRLDAAGREAALEALIAGRRQLPWVVLFGDLHVLLGEPLLEYLAPTTEVGRVLVSSHPNFELLESSTNGCGLDGEIGVPTSPERVLEVVGRAMGRVATRRARYDALRAAIREERARLADVARTSSRLPTDEVRP